MTLSLKAIQRTNDPIHKFSQTALVVAKDSVKSSFLRLILMFELDLNYTVFLIIDIIEDAS